MADPAAAIARFNLTCPTGGAFHICTTTTLPFLGCCTVDPCTAARDGTCPPSNLRSSSFNPDMYEDLPRQDCDDPESIRMWYTCKFNNPPFMGCCASNACGEGLCAPADLRPAKLSGDEGLRALFLGAGTTTSATVAPSATGTVVPSGPVPVVEEKGGGLSIGAIVGIVVGAVALVAVVFGAYKLGGARKRKERGLMSEGPEYQQTGSRDGGPAGGGEGDMSAQGLGIQKTQYRDSTFSGSTAFSPPMTQHATFPTAYEAKTLAVSSPEFGRQPSPGRHSFVSAVYTTTGSPGPYGSNVPGPYNHPGVPAVELPVEAPQVQELPAGERTSHMSQQYAPSELYSGHSTPLASPGFPDEQAPEQGGGYGQGSGYGYGRS